MGGVPRDFRGCGMKVQTFRAPTAQHTLDRIIENQGGPSLFTVSAYLHQLAEACKNDEWDSDFGEDALRRTAEQVERINIELQWAFERLQKGGAS